MIVDFHSHILPSMDDGSRSVRETLDMLRMMKAQGIERVVATPHFYASHDFPDSFLERRDKAREKVLQEMEGEDLPEILVGAEVAYFRGMSQSKALQDLVIEGTRAILIEMPMGSWSSSMYEELERIHDSQGLIPVVAHVDRYLTPLRSFGIPGKLSELPVLVQANASFFLHRNTARKALRMLRAEQIHLLGSDCHNLHERSPNLGDAAGVIREHLGEGALERIAGWQNEILKLHV